MTTAISTPNLKEFQVELTRKYQCAVRRTYIETTPDGPRLTGVVGGEGFEISFGERPQGFTWEIYTPRTGVLTSHSLDEVDKSYFLSKDVSITFEEFKKELNKMYPKTPRPWVFSIQEDEGSIRLTGTIGDMDVSYGERPWGLTWEIYTPHAGVQSAPTLAEADEEYLSTFFF